MSISFHCEGCTKSVEAPDTLGGKWGKCPNCGRECYIPMPASAFEDDDELTLTPVDEEEEKRYQALKMQAFGLAQNILQETQIDDTEDEDANDGPVSERELIRLIVIYLRLMADGKLDQAKENEKKIISNSEIAAQILRQMTKTQQPEPELANIPPRLLQGFIKNLNSKLG